MAGHPTPLTWALAGLSFWSLSSPVAATEPSSVQPPAAAASAASAPATQKLEAVVVSGDKLRRSELESTQSVATRNGRQIDESASLSMEDVLTRMANVGTAQNLTIRGIALYGPTGGDGRTATVSVDGVAQEGRGQTVGDLSIWDAEGIEVLRGPQSTNQGRNALAGAVLLKTRNPTDEWELRTRVSQGNYNSTRLAVAGGGALVKDLAAFRLAIEGRRSDGSLNNETRQDPRWNHDDASTVRGKLRLTPFAGDYQALLTLSDARNRQGRGFVETTLRRPEQRIALANEASGADMRSRHAALEQTWSAWGAEWTWLSTWANNRYDRAFDYDDTELNQGRNDGVFTDRQVTQELRANFSAMLAGHALKGVVGLYAANTRGESDNHYVVPVSYVLGVIGRCPDLAACEALYAADFINRTNLSGERLRNRAVFSEFDYQLGPWTLTAGLRYDRASQDRQLGALTTGTSALATQMVALLLRAGQLAPDGTQQLETRYNAWLPKLALRYQLSADWQTGLTVQRGYRTGGINYSYQRGPNAFAPEYTSNYEISLKGQVLPGVLLSTNLYRVDWRDQQVNVGSNSLDVFYVNAGRSRLHGLEFELRGQVLPKLEAFAALGLSRTKFTNFVLPTADYSGKQFPNSPRQTASLGLTWKPGAWAISSDVVYEGGRFSDAANTAETRNPSHTLLNTKLSYALNPKVRVFAYGNNLLNQSYTTYRTMATSTRQVALLGEARLFGLGLEAQL